MHEVLIGWMNRECQKAGLKWIYTRWQNYWKVTLLHSSTYAEFRALHSKRHSSHIKEWRGKERRSSTFQLLEKSLQAGFTVPSLSSWTCFGNCISDCVWCETRETGLGLYNEIWMSAIQWPQKVFEYFKLWNCLCTL